MGRKVITVIAVIMVTLCALCAPTYAATHEVYTEGNISTTYLTYFEDILSGMKFTDNYVAFRSGQYEYTMIVGKLTNDNGTIKLEGEGKEYTFTTSTGYNATYQYHVENLTDFSVDVGNNIIYSDVGDFPELIERGAKVETLTLMLIGIVCVFSLAERVLRHS